nr:hypothetical protein [Tanacetum cinerariifolium]
MYDSLERAATTATSLDAEQDKELCTNLQNRVFDLETTKTTQAIEIESLKRRVKKLEKKQRSRTHKLKRLYKVGLSTRVESSEDKGSGEEDASKQGRISDIDADDDITLVSTHDEQMFDGDRWDVSNLHPFLFKLEPSWLEIRVLPILKSLFLPFSYCQISS